MVLNLCSCIYLYKYIYIYLPGARPLWLLWILLLGWQITETHNNFRLRANQKSGSLLSQHVYHTPLMGNKTRASVECFSVHINECFANSYIHSLAWVGFDDMNNNPLSQHQDIYSDRQQSSPLIGWEIHYFCPTFVSMRYDQLYNNTLSRFFNIRSTVVVTLPNQPRPRNTEGNKVVLDRSLLSVQHYGNGTRRLSGETLNPCPMYRWFTPCTLVNQMDLVSVSLIGSSIPGFHVYVGIKA